MIENEKVSSAVNISIYDVFKKKPQNGVKPINLTVGNPNLKPPALYYQVMHEVIHELENSDWNGHGYIVEEDPFGLCKKIAGKLCVDYGKPFSNRDVAITVGATGAIDIILKTILDPGKEDPGQNSTAEAIIIAPYFIEYTNMVQSNNGRTIIVNSNEAYGLDFFAIEQSITRNTKVIIINSPNNPTGKIYTENELVSLAKLLKEKNREYGICIKVIEDSVYDAIVFSDNRPPSLIPHYPYLFRVNSYSKSMSLSGERIGYFAIHPEIGDDEMRNLLRSDLHLNMRMRVVHAPLLQHRILAKLPVDCVTDITCYKRNIETLHTCLNNLGFKVVKPEGAFYLWAVLPDYYKGEERFRTFAQSGNNPLLYLPGRLFGGITYSNCVRFSGCVSHEVILLACEKLIEIDNRITKD